MFNRPEKVPAVHRALMSVCLALAMAACSGGADGDAAERSPASAAAAPLPAVAPAEAKATTAVTAADVAIVEQSFAYGATAERNFVGFFAAPEQIVEPLPGIVLVHERWGLDDSIRSIARNLARAGYAVMAVDLFDGQTADDATAAQALVDVATAGREGSLDNISQAVDYLRAYALAPRVALVGYGLGGGLVLEAAVATPGKIDAVVTYYGRLIFDTEMLAKLRAPLLGIYAEQDESIPVRDVQSFRRSLRDLGNDADVLIYSDSRHGFADPGRSTFDPQNAGEAWQETVAFLEDRLDPPRDR